MPTHGSLTKAGKVRKVTPYLPKKPRRKLIPRKARERQFWLRYILGRAPKQFRTRVRQSR